MSEEELYYERRLQNEIEKIEAAIKELTNEKSALERQLLKARKQMPSLADVNRKNSINRIMIERKIIETLASKKSMATAALYKAAREVIFDLNENTFRTHLHRMKLKGLIESTPTRGKWRLPSNKELLKNAL